MDNISFENKKKIKKHQIINLLQLLKACRLYPIFCSQRERGLEEFLGIIKIKILFLVFFLVSFCFKIT